MIKNLNFSSLSVASNITYRTYTRSLLLSHTFRYHLVIIYPECLLGHAFGENVVKYIISVKIYYSDAQF